MGAVSGPGHGVKGPHFIFLRKTSLEYTMNFKRPCLCKRDGVLMVQSPREKQFFLFRLQEKATIPYPVCSSTVRLCPTRLNEYCCLSTITQYLIIVIAWWYLTAFTLKSSTLFSESTEDPAARDNKDFLLFFGCARCCGSKKGDR